MLRILATWCLLGGLASAAAAQTVYLTEDFEGPFPPPGWVNESSPLSFGWAPTPTSVIRPNRRVFDYFDPFLSRPDDYLWTTVDLTTATTAYTHIDVEVEGAIWYVTNPNSSTTAVFEIVARPAGTTTWRSIWQDCRTVDRRDVLTALLPQDLLGQVIDIGFHLYYGGWGPEINVDRFQVDDSPVAPAIAPRPFAWVPLPSGVATAPYFQDFENGAQPELKVSTKDPYTNQTEACGWCSFSNTAGNVYSGGRVLEMGIDPLDPNCPAYPGQTVHDVLVIAVDTSPLSHPYLQFAGYAYDSPDSSIPEIDGIWISGDGVDWYPLTYGWRYVLTRNTWQVSRIPLWGTPVDTNGTIYLMFSYYTSSTFGWNGYSYGGLAFDAVSVEDGSPCTPMLTMTGSCPGEVVVEVDRVAPGGRLYLLYGPSGSFTWTGTPCGGLTVDLQGPRVAQIADPTSTIVCFPAPALPSRVCGLFLQAVDTSTCCASNTLVL